MSVITSHTCDRKACLGCSTLKLQSLCYAGQQCTVTSCIGTIVNQNRPLCNAGLVLKSHTEGTLFMILGAWLIFTETYTTILDAALLGPPRSTNIKWVDNAFFSYFCSAKVSGIAMRGPMHACVISIILTMHTCACCCCAGHAGPSHFDSNVKSGRWHRHGTQ